MSLDKITRREFGRLFSCALLSFTDIQRAVEELFRAIGPNPNTPLDSQLNNQIFDTLEMLETYQQQPLFTQFRGTIFTTGGEDPYRTFFADNPLIPLTSPAEIRLTNIRNNRTYATGTNNLGEIREIEIPSGCYQIEIEALDNLISRSSLVAGVGQNRNVDYFRTLIHNENFADFYRMFWGRTLPIEDLIDPDVIPAPSGLYKLTNLEAIYILDTEILNASNGQRVPSVEEVNNVIQVRNELSDLLPHLNLANVPIFKASNPNHPRPEEVFTFLHYPSGRIDLGGQGVRTGYVGVYWDDSLSNRFGISGGTILYIMDPSTNIVRPLNDIANQQGGEIISAAITLTLNMDLGLYRHEGYRAFGGALNSPLDPRSIMFVIGANQDYTPLDKRYLLTVSEREPRNGPRILGSSQIDLDQADTDPSYVSHINNISAYSSKRIYAEAHKSMKKAA